MSTEIRVPGAAIAASAVPRAEEILTPAALEFVADLHRTFNPRRLALLERRVDGQAHLDRGERPAFLKETEAIRRGDWKVAPAPADLRDRRVEITGPADRRMMINALNSGAQGFMADLEDSLSPTWANVVEGQVNLLDAVRRRLRFTSEQGREYALKDEVATLLVRPRGWHLCERHVEVDAGPISASLFDAGLFLFHNARETLSRRSGPYFYLPKLESHLEARLWNEVFNHAQDRLGVPRGSVRATVLIETFPAAFEMDEILYELREHGCSLNAGRWDYIFSVIKKLRSSRLVFPDRARITMNVPFMRAYTDLLVRTCHRRGAHAIGGMAAFIPSRKDPEVNEVAMFRVREDKRREATDGFDGTWVAHPDLVPIARAEFSKVLGARPNQTDRPREEVTVGPHELTDFHVPDGAVTEEGVRNNVSVALQYLDHWLRGVGAVGIFNLMEDVATAEISRSQLWQWVHRGARLDDGRALSAALYRELLESELEKLGGAGVGRYRDAAEVLDALVLGDDFVEFLTLSAYERLERRD
jgi:malate synthase